MGTKDKKNLVEFPDGFQCFLSRHQLGNLASPAGKTKSKTISGKRTDSPRGTPEVTVTCYEIEAKVLHGEKEKRERNRTKIYVSPSTKKGTTERDGKAKSRYALGRRQHGLML